MNKKYPECKTLKRKKGEKNPCFKLNPELKFYPGSNPLK
jgi:hypothetical protein